MHSPRIIPNMHLPRILQQPNTQQKLQMIKARKRLEFSRVLYEAIMPRTLRSQRWRQHPAEGHRRRLPSQNLQRNQRSHALGQLGGGTWHSPSAGQQTSECAKHSGRRFSPSVLCMRPVGSARRRRQRNPVRNPKSPYSTDQRSQRRTR